MLASSLTPSKTKRANLTWWSSEIMHRGHIWHDYPWPWVSLAWLLYNLQLDDVKGADFEKSQYAFGQSEKRSMYINMINQYTTLRYIWRTISSVETNFNNCIFRNFGWKPSLYMTNFLRESLCLYLPKRLGRVFWSSCYQGRGAYHQKKFSEESTNIFLFIQIRITLERYKIVALQSVSIHYKYVSLRLRQKIKQAQQRGEKSSILL